jgi:hypothetical protein
VDALESNKPENASLMLEVGHHYQNSLGETIKVLARTQKDMLPPADTLVHLDTDPASLLTRDCFLCRDNEGNDFYALANGQTCGVWKGGNGESLYSLPGYGTPLDAILEIAAEKVDIRRFDDDFTLTWRLQHAIRLSLRLHARNADRAFDLLPPISEIERAIQSLFEARGIEIEASEYDPTQCVIEEEDNDHE